MKEIEVVFTKSKKWLPLVSWLIRLYTWKPYSHVAGSHEIRNWGKRYYQASEGRVNYEYETFFHKKHEIVKSYKIKVNEALERESKKAFYQQAGNKYATMQNIGVVWVDINKLFGRKIDNPYKAGKNCSEILYNTVFKKLIPELDYNPDTIKPHHIEDIIKTYFKEDNGYWTVK